MTTEPTWKPKMQVTSWMSLSLWVQGRMNACDAGQGICLFKPRPVSTAAMSHRARLAEGQKHISQNTQSIPMLASLHSSKGGGDKIISEPHQTGHRMFAKSRQQEGWHLFPQPQ